MDNRLFGLNFQPTELIGDPAFADEVKQMVEMDFAGSSRMDGNTVADIPLWHRLAFRGANSFASAL